jgi:hypothetical protein
VADIAVDPTLVTFRIPTDGVTESNYPYLAGIAGEEIEAGSVVYRDENNEILLASASGLAESRCLGISANHAYEGQPVSVCGPNGDVDLGVTLGVGDDLHLSLNAGKICLIADVAAGSGFVTRLGKVTGEFNLKLNVEAFDVQL